MPKWEEISCFLEKAAIKEAGGKMIVQVPERFWRFYNLDRKHKGGFDKREQSLDNGYGRHS